MSVSGKTAVIIGGGSGLGAATAFHLSEKGARVVVCDRSFHAADSVAERCSALAFEMDVCDSGQVAETIEQIKLGGNRIDAVVNCAGICAAQRVLGREGLASLDHFEAVIKVNLVGAFNVIRLFADAMANQEPLSEEGDRGVLINTASIAAFEGQIGQAAYSASKAGVVGMTLPLAREFSRVGIRVMSIAPGVFDTPMMKAMGAERSAQLTDGIPLPKRLGRPAEFAGLVEHIIRNPYLNGECIRLDACLRMA